MVQVVHVVQGGARSDRFDLNHLNDLNAAALESSSLVTGVNGGNDITHGQDSGL
jgi:hypothetical protein